MIKRHFDHMITGAGAGGMGRIAIRTLSVGFVVQLPQSLVIPDFKGIFVLRMKSFAAVTAVAAATFLGAAESPSYAGTGLLIAVHINNFEDWGNFNQDPVESTNTPGDAIRACDFTSDGWAVTTYLDIGSNGTWDRTATTAGQPSGDCGAWETGNIAEGTKVTIKACNTKAGHDPKNCDKDTTVA